MWYGSWWPSAQSCFNRREGKTLHCWFSPWLLLRSSPGKRVGRLWFPHHSTCRRWRYNRSPTHFLAPRPFWVLPWWGAQTFRCIHFPTVRWGVGDSMGVIAATSNSWLITGHTLLSCPRLSGKEKNCGNGNSTFCSSLTYLLKKSWFAYPLECDRQHHVRWLIAASPLYAHVNWTPVSNDWGLILSRSE